MVRISKSSRSPRGLSQRFGTYAYGIPILVLILVILMVILFTGKGGGVSSWFGFLTNGSLKTSTTLSLLEEKSHDNAAAAVGAMKDKNKLLSKPVIMYGTAWKKDKTAAYVEEAAVAGFRFIDTACQPKHYNEVGVGVGWRKAATSLGLQREDFFLQTKFTDAPGQDPNTIPYDPDASIEDQVRTSLTVSLKNLQTDYLDSLVMHSPRDSVEETMEVWRIMETFVDEGKVLRLGLSNCYDFTKFTTIYSMARIKPWVLQNRFYAQSNFDTELRAFLKENGVRYQSFWTLTANRQALKKPEVHQLAEAKGLTPETFLFAFLMSLGYVIPLSGSTNRKHMEEDVAVMERIQAGEVFFETDQELRQMAELLGMPDL
jgi:diketogulonate reductase-like aldo/keto reductase